MTHQSPRQDVYIRVTNRIVAELEKGVRPWVKPWFVEHAAGRITRPLRHNGIPSAAEPPSRQSEQLAGDG